MSVNHKPQVRSLSNWHRNPRTISRERAERVLRLRQDLAAEIEREQERLRAKAQKAGQGTNAVSRQQLIERGLITPKKEN